MSKVGGGALGRGGVAFWARDGERSTVFKILNANSRRSSVPNHPCSSNTNQRPPGALTARGTMN